MNHSIIIGITNSSINYKVNNIRGMQCSGDLFKLYRQVLKLLHFAKYGQLRDSMQHLQVLGMSF